MQQDDIDINSVVVSNGGRWFATTGNERDEVRIWNGQQGRLWREWPDAGVPDTFGPDGSQLLLVRENGEGERSLVLRAVPSGKLLQSFTLSESLFFDGKTIRGVQHGALLIFDAATGKQLRQVKLRGASEDGSYVQFALSPNGRFVAGADHSHTESVARLWDGRTGKLLRTITGDRNVVGAAAASSDGKWLLTEGENPQWYLDDGPHSEASYARQWTIKLWSVRTGKLKHVWPGRQAGSVVANLLQFSRDGSSVLLNEDDYISAWDITSGKSAPGPANRAWSQVSFQHYLAISPDEQWLAGVGNYHEFYPSASYLLLVNAATGQLVQRFRYRLHR